MKIKAFSINILSADPGHHKRDFYSDEHLVSEFMDGLEEKAAALGISLSIVPQRGEQIAEFTFPTADSIVLEAEEFLLPPCPACECAPMPDVCPMPCTCKVATARACSSCYAPVISPMEPLKIAVPEDSDIPDSDDPF